MRHKPGKVLTIVGLGWVIFIKQLLSALIFLFFPLSLKSLILSFLHLLHLFEFLMFVSKAAAIVLSSDVAS